MSERKVPYSLSLHGDIQAGSDNPSTKISAPKGRVVFIHPIFIMSNLHARKYMEGIDHNLLIFYIDTGESRMGLSNGCLCFYQIVKRLLYGYKSVRFCFWI